MTLSSEIPKNVNRPDRKMYDFFITKLQEAVAERFQRRIATTCDFNQLSEAIKASVNDTLGASTLKRIWKYIEPNTQPRQSSLSILARYVGFEDFAAFCQSVSTDDADSGFLSTEVFYTHSAIAGQRIEIKWLPDRRIIIRCVGEARFIVESNENSRLVENTLISIPYLIEGRTMVADVLLPERNSPVAYEAGRNGGITWRHLADSPR